MTAQPTQALAEAEDNPVFFDPFACMLVALAAARNRNQLAVRARLAGDPAKARAHQDYARFYFNRVRQWRDMLEPSEGASNWH